MREVPPLKHQCLIGTAVVTVLLVGCVLAAVYARTPGNPPGRTAAFALFGVTVILATAYVVRECLHKAANKQQERLANTAVTIEQVYEVVKGKQDDYRISNLSYDQRTELLRLVQPDEQFPGLSDQFDKCDYTQLPTHVLRKLLNDSASRGITRTYIQTHQEQEVISRTERFCKIAKELANRFDFDFNELEGFAFSLVHALQGVTRIIPQTDARDDRDAGYIAFLYLDSATFENIVENFGEATLAEFYRIARENLDCNGSETVRAKMPRLILALARKMENPLQGLNPETREIDFDSLAGKPLLEAIADATVLKRILLPEDVFGLEKSYHIYEVLCAFTTQVQIQQIALHYYEQYENSNNRSLTIVIKGVMKALDELPASLDKSSRFAREYPGVKEAHAKDLELIAALNAQAFADKDPRQLLELYKACDRKLIPPAKVKLARSMILLELAKVNTLPEGLEIAKLPEYLAGLEESDHVLQALKAFATQEQIIQMAIDYQANFSRNSHTTVEIKGVMKALEALPSKIPPDSWFACIFNELKNPQ
ncbi:MAG: hypothetical protein H7A36_07380 [Chlamydiales bacterium]|nr:hypothetical protein [Chlamydiales bacterium]